MAFWWFYYEGIKQPHTDAMFTKMKTTPSSSSREVRIRVPFFLQSILVGEPSPQKKGKRAPSWDLDPFVSFAGFPPVLSWKIKSA